MFSSWVFSAPFSDFNIYSAEDGSNADTSITRDEEVVLMVAGPSKGNRIGKMFFSAQTWIVNYSKLHKISDTTLF